MPAVSLVLVSSVAVSPLAFAVSPVVTAVLLVAVSPAMSVVAFVVLSLVSMFSSPVAASPW